MYTRPAREELAEQSVHDARVVTHEPQHGHLLALQSSAGNSAVGRFIQRQSLSVQLAPAEPRLRRGSTGSGVRKLQQRLNARGHEPPLKIDGIFGPLTQGAVEEFQSTHDLEPDGKVGPLTWGAIEQAAGERAIEPEQDELGQHVVEKMDENNNDPHTLTQGVHYSYNFLAECEKQNRMDLWKDEYREGYADPQYFEHIGYMDWRLKQKMSASAALRSWLRGLTVAECNSAVVAMEIDAVRAAIGDTKFDDRYGSTDKAIPVENRLRIKQGIKDTIVADLMVNTDASGGTAGHRPVEPGDWCYFYNHPKYLLKHPGGAWQGENALYMGEDPNTGEQLWSGMGADRLTEDQMLLEMVKAYNQPRDAEDERALRERFPHGPPAEYDPANGEFPDQLSGPADILSAPEYELGGTKRKGGFVDRGRRLDADKVRKIADE